VRARECPPWCTRLTAGHTVHQRCAYAGVSLALAQASGPPEIYVSDLVLDVDRALQLAGVLERLGQEDTAGAIRVLAGLTEGA